MVQRLVFACAAVLLAVLLVDAASARNGAIEDGRFDFDNDGTVASALNYFRGHDEARDDDDDEAVSADTADDQDQDEQDQEEQEEPEQHFMDSAAINSLYQAKPLAAAASAGQRTKQRSYCHPPNPCPKGHTPEKNGCDANVQDTAEWNRLDQERNMRMGYCACDVEHMFTCPPGVPTVSVASAKQAQQQQQQQQQQVQAKRSPYIFI